MELREKLFELSDIKYREFSRGINPNSIPIIGVRIPILRDIAKEISKNSFKDFLKEGYEDYLEELLLKGMVIGYCKTDINEKLEMADEFIPKISDWLVNDTFCSGFKCARNNKEKVYEFLIKYVDSEKEFEQRVVAVMLMDYYLNDEYVDRVLNILDSLKNDGYYAKMGVAWAIATSYAKFPEKTHYYLKNSNTLADFTYNKSIIKMIESKRISGDVKENLKQMIRK